MIRTQLFTVELAPQTISCTVSSRLSCISFFITVPSITAALVGLSVASVCLLCALYKHNAWAIITKASRDSPWWSLGKLLSQCDSEVKWSWLGSDYGWDGRTSSVYILIQMHIFLVFFSFFWFMYKCFWFLTLSSRQGHAGSKSLHQQNPPVLTGGAG